MFGTFCIPLMFLLCRELNLSISCSLLVACLCLFDNLLLVESRLILLESQLVCYLILTLLLAARVWRLSETSPRSYAYYFALIGAALAGAAATSVKWSGAITPTLIALTCILGLGVQTWPMAMQDCGLACVVGTIGYLIPWYIHLVMSTKYTAAADVMSTTFKRRLIGNMTTERFNLASFFVQAVVELHLRQMKANAAVKTRHVWESKWWQWPLNQGGMLYYMDKKTLRAIYLTQNAAGAMWITITVMIYVIIATTACRYKLGKVGNRMRDVVKKGGFFMCGFVFNLVPFVLVQRCYFLYHYLPALMHAQLLLGVMVDALPNRLGVVVSVVVILSVMISFFLSAPLIYCTPMTVRHLLRQPWISTGGK